MIDDFGLNIKAIRKTADWAIQQRGPHTKGMISVVSGGSVIAARLEIPEVEPLLSNDTVMTAIRVSYNLIVHLLVS